MVSRYRPIAYLAELTALTEAWIARGNRCHEAFEAWIFGVTAVHHAGRSHAADRAVRRIINTRRASTTVKLTRHSHKRSITTNRLCGDRITSRLSHLWHTLGAATCYKLKTILFLSRFEFR
jgi:hypothetical protein